MKLKEYSVSVGKRVVSAEQDFEERFGEPGEVSESEYRWSNPLFAGSSLNWLYDSEVVLDRTDGSVSVNVSTYDCVRYPVWLILLLSPVVLLAVTSLKVLAAAWIVYYGVGLVLLGPPLDLIKEQGLVEAETNSYHSTIFLAGLLVLMKFVYLTPQLFVFDLLFLAAAVAVTGQLYFEGSIPEVSSGQGSSVFSIPILVILVLAGTLLLLFGLAYFSPVVLAVVEPRLGGVVQYVGLGLWVSVVVGYFFAVGKASKSLQTSLEQTRHIPPFRFGRSRYVLLGMYLLMNLVVLSASVLAVDILWFGVAGGHVLPFYVWAGDLGMVRLVEQSFTGFNAVFSAAPVFPARYYTASVFLLFSTPLITLYVGWAVLLVTGIRSKIQLLSDRDRVYSGEDIAETDTRVVVVEAERPEVRAVPILFGWWNVVVVSQQAWEHLDEDELKAVIAHEEYHVKNRDTRAAAAASVLGVLCGGRNALLAFYNYPEAELQADKYAAEQVGVEPLVQALKELDLLRKRAYLGGEAGVRSIYPGIIGIPSSEDGNSVFSGVVDAVVAWYQALFGGALLERTHQPVDDRINAVQTIKTGPL